VEQDKQLATGLPALPGALPYIKVNLFSIMNKQAKMS
jgi:hypothetical protein